MGEMEQKVEKPSSDYSIAEHGLCSLAIFVVFGPKDQVIFGPKDQVACQDYNIIRKFYLCHL